MLVFQKKTAVWQFLRHCFPYDHSNVVLLVEEQTMSCNIAMLYVEILSDPT